MNGRRPGRTQLPAVVRPPAKDLRRWPLWLGLASILLVLRWYSSGPTVEASRALEGGTPAPVTPRETADEPRRPRPDQDDGPVVQEVPVLVGGGFKPVNFHMAAVSHHIPLTAQAPGSIRRLPPIDPQWLRYAELDFSSGAKVHLVLNAALAGYRLFVDRNGNGDLTDDGPGLDNQGSGLFAASLRLPMALVSGRRDLGGDYLLWLFTNDKERPPASISYYARTQLQGEISLPAGRFTAYLADNQSTDGDFTNDGIAIDLDRDRRIDLTDEFFSPGRPALIQGQRYRFSISY